MSSYLDDFCVGPCPQGCMGPSCRNYGKTRVYVCDECGCETTNPEYDGWDLEDGDLCPTCADLRREENTKN